MKKRGPWKVKGSRIAYQTPWLTVREDAVIGPNGKHGTFGVVIMAPGVSVIPLDEQGNIYLVKEYHYAIGKTTIEAACGGIERGEGRLVAAKRELKEETGFGASRWTYLGVAHPFTTQIDSDQYMYLARGLRRGKMKLDDTERITVLKVSLAKALRWVDDGTITRPTTAVALFKVRDMLSRPSRRRSVAGRRGSGMLSP